MKVWVYRSRNGNHAVFAEDAFLMARTQQDEDNRVTAEELLEDDPNAVYGSEEEGKFSIDDGGDIELFEVTEWPGESVPD